MSAPTPTPDPSISHNTQKAKAKRKPRKLPVWLTPDESARLIAAAPTKRDRLIILIGLYAGLRVSEITALRAERIDFDRRQILVYQGKGGKDRYVPIHAKLMEPLKAWVGYRLEGLLFRSPRGTGKPLTTRAVQIMMRAAMQSAGIRRPAGTKQPTPHTLRHTFASRLIEKGADIKVAQELLGHASMATTQVYLHVDTQRLRGAVDEI